MFEVNAGSYFEASVQVFVHVILIAPDLIFLELYVLIQHGNGEDVVDNGFARRVFSIELGL